MKLLNLIYERFIFLLLLFGALILVANIGYLIYRTVSSFDWQPVMADVTLVKFVKHDDSLGRKDSYERVLAYQYTYANEAFTSEREYFGMRRFFSSMNSDYQEGQQIEVYVDPDAPDQSVIKRYDITTIALQMLLLLIFFTGAYFFKPKPGGAGGPVNLTQSMVRTVQVT